MPLVSVIVPIYNVSEYLEDCLSSIVNQTMDDIEVICVNDGSTDDSLEIIERFASNDDRIKVIDKGNAGYGAAMNDGIEAAEGQYIGIVEPDDFIDENMFARLYEIATSSDEDYDMVKSAWKEFTEGDPDGSIKNPYKNVDCERPIDLEKEIGPLLPHPSIWSGLYKKAFLDANNIRFKAVPGAGWVDNPFFLETLYFAETPVFTSDHFYNYRVNNEASSTELKDALIPFTRLLEMLDFLDAHEERPNFRKALYWRAFTYLRSTMNSKSYPKQAEEASALIRRFFSRMPEGMIEDSYFSKEDKANYLLFAQGTSITPKSQCPLISIVVPCYNVAKYINNCVDSLKAQTLKDIEVIFVDDGSSDYTRAKLYARTLDDDRMRVVLQDNGGAGAARNNGLKLASGEYVTFLDADDLYEPTLAEDAYSQAKRVDADLVIYGADFYYDKPKRYEDVSWLDLGVFPDEDVFTASDITHDNVFKSTNGWTWDKLFRTEFVKTNDIKFQELRTHNDMLFTYTAFLLANSITVCHKKLIHQRKGHGASLSQTGGKSWWCADEALSAVENMLKTNGLYQRYERDFKNYVVHILRYSTINMHGSTVLGKLYNAIKNEWIPKYELPTNEGYYWVPWEYTWLIHTINNSTEDILIDELRAEIAKRKKAEKEKHAALKKLRNAKVGNKNLKKEIAKLKKDRKASKGIRSIRAAKTTKRIMGKIRR